MDTQWSYHYSTERNFFFFSSVLYIPPRVSEAAGLKPSSPGGIIRPLCPSLPPKHVAVKENIPFMISSQLRVKPVQFVIEEAVDIANKSPVEQRGGSASPCPGKLLAMPPNWKGESRPAKHWSICLRWLPHPHSQSSLVQDFHILSSSFFFLPLVSFALGKAFMNTAGSLILPMNFTSPRRKQSLKLASESCNDKLVIDTFSVTPECYNKYHRLESLNKRNAFLTVVETGSLTSACQHGWVLMRSLFLSWRQLSSHCNLTWGGG